MGFPGESLDGSSLRTMPHADITQWMLKGMNIHSRARPGDETPAVLFTDLYKKETPDQQKKLASALTDALTAWDPDVHSSEVLADLCVATQFIDNEAPISALVSRIDENKLPGPDNYKARFQIISTVVGFINYPQHHDTVVRWYENPEFDWKPKYTMFLGFADVEPENIEPRLPIFFRLITDHYDESMVNVCVDLLRIGLGENRVRTLFEQNKHEGATRALHSLENVLKTVN